MIFDLLYGMCGSSIQNFSEVMTAHGRSTRNLGFHAPPAGDAGSCYITRARMPSHQHVSLLLPKCLVSGSRISLSAVERRPKAESRPSKYQRRRGVDPGVDRSPFDAFVRGDSLIVRVID